MVPEEKEAVLRCLEVAYSLIPRVVLPQACLTVGSNDIDVTDVQEFVRGCVMHAHGLSTKERETAQGT